MQRWNEEQGAPKGENAHERMEKLRRTQWALPEVAEIMRRLNELGQKRFERLPAFFASIGVDPMQLRTKGESLLSFERDVLPQSPRFEAVLREHLAVDLPWAAELLAVCKDVFEKVVDGRLPPFCASLCGSVLNAALVAFSEEMSSLCEIVAEDAEGASEDSEG